MDKDSIIFKCPECPQEHIRHKTVISIVCDCGAKIRRIEDKKVAYVCGCYRSDSDYGLLVNIKKAEEAAHALWKLGWVVICPHKNSERFSCKEIPEHYFLDGYKAIISRLIPGKDIIVTLNNHWKSEGSQDEIEFAAKLGIEIRTYESLIEGT